MSLVDDIKRMREDGCSDELIYMVMVTAVFRETVEELALAFEELDSAAGKEHSHESVTKNVAAASIKVGAYAIAERDIDVTIHYLALVARTIVDDAAARQEETVAVEPVEPVQTPPKDISKLN